MLKTNSSYYLSHILIISNVGQTFSITTGLRELLIALYDDGLVVVHTLHKQHGSYQLRTHGEPDFLLKRKKTQFMGSGMDWRNPWLAKMSKGKKKRKHWQSSQLFHTRKIYWNPSNWLVCLFVWGFGGSGWGFYYWVNTNCYNYTAVGCLFISYLNSSPS